MLSIFFQKAVPFPFLVGQNYFRTTSLMDSGCYVFERVKDPPQGYVQANYFLTDHQLVVPYFAAWSQVETVLQKLPPKPIPKEKKSLLANLAARKLESKQMETRKSKEEVKTVQENCLYVQLDAFSEIEIPTKIEQIVLFMSLIYLLACRVGEETGEWPMMIPVLTEGNLYKFVKKGKGRKSELRNFLNYMVTRSQISFLREWSESLHNAYKNGSNNIQELLENKLEESVREKQMVTVRVENQSREEQAWMEDHERVRLEGGQTLYISEFTVRYHHKSHDRRQILLEHEIFADVALEAANSSLIVKYLRQLMIN